MQSLFGQVRLVLELQRHIILLRFANLHWHLAILQRSHIHRAVITCSQHGYLLWPLLFWFLDSLILRIIKIGTHILKQSVMQHPRRLLALKLRRSSHRVLLLLQVILVWRHLFRSELCSLCPLNQAVALRWQDLRLEHMALP